MLHKGVPGGALTATGTMLQSQLHVHWPPSPTQPRQSGSARPAVQACHERSDHACTSADAVASSLTLPADVGQSGPCAGHHSRRRWRVRSSAEVRCLHVDAALSRSSPHMTIPCSSRGVPAVCCAPFAFLRPCSLASRQESSCRQAGRNMTEATAWAPSICSRRSSSRCAALINVRGTAARSKPSPGCTAWLGQRPHHRRMSGAAWWSPGRGSEHRQWLQL